MISWEDGHTFESYGIGERGNDHPQSNWQGFSDQHKTPNWKDETNVNGMNTVEGLKSLFYTWVPGGKGAEF